MPEFDPNKPLTITLSVSTIDATVRIWLWQHDEGRTRAFAPETLQGNARTRHELRLTGRTSLAGKCEIHGHSEAIKVVGAIGVVIQQEGRPSQSLSSGLFPEEPGFTQWTFEVRLSPEPRAVEEPDFAQWPFEIRLSPEPRAVLEGRGSRSSLSDVKPSEKEHWYQSGNRREDMKSSELEFRAARPGEMPPLDDFLPSTPPSPSAASIPSTPEPAPAGKPPTLEWGQQGRFDLSRDLRLDIEEQRVRDLRAEKLKPAPPTGTAKRTSRRGRRASAAKKDLLYRVWFGTNRKPVPGLPIDEPFTSERSDAVHHGYCDVFIPESHKIGSLGSPWWKRLFIGDDRVTLRKTKELAEQTFWRQVAKACRRIAEDERQAVVYIHGYNTSFKEAARRAAQLGADLEIRGAMGFFSWPSQGTKQGYIPDSAAIEASEAHIADFLADFATQSGSDRVHVIAHSMGNRGLLRAISRIVADATRLSACRFTHLILAAPDVDTNVFIDLARNFEKVAKRATLYVSHKDVLLEASSWLHDYPRAGIRPPVTVVPKIDTIDVGRIDLSLLGHSYVGADRDVLHDMHRLIHSDAVPAKRMGLADVVDPGGARYWAIRA